MSRPSFDHVVWVLLEGRSYDNLFGSLTPSTEWDDWELTPKHPNWDFLPLTETGRGKDDIEEQLATENGYFKNYQKYTENGEEIYYRHTKETLPVLYGLHQNFASCDSLFCDTRNGPIDNLFYLLSGRPRTTTKISGTILDQTEHFISNNPSLVKENIIPWKVYHDQGHHFTPSYIKNARKDINTANYCSMEQFHIDMKSKLPLLSIIEANTNIDGSGWSGVPGGNSITEMELKLREIVKSYIESSHIRDTVLMFIWLDGGGIYDHVPPPVLLHPKQNMDIPPHQLETGPVEEEKVHHQLGPRVPFIMINTAINKNTMIHDKKLTHSSILKTTQQFLGMPYFQTERIKTVNLLAHKKMWNNHKGKFMKRLVLPQPATPSFILPVHTSKIGNNPETEGLAFYYHRMVTCHGRKNCLTRDKSHGLSLEYENNDTQDYKAKITGYPTDDNNTNVGYWLLFSAIVVWALLVIIFLWVACKPRN